MNRTWKRSFLGFSFTSHQHRIRIAKESVKRMRDKIRQLTSRSRPIPMDRRIQELNRYLMGWCSYFKLAETSTVFRRLDEWL
ncbi:group II intron maturase-specific domain-containing protein [Kroppenstedtia guangzhouensis]|nr:group II intron maturase-specific domain-containing protein [Kroppenstedtia guangzhouensis]